MEAKISKQKFDEKTAIYIVSKVIFYRLCINNKEKKTSNSSVEKPGQQYIKYGQN